LPADHGGGFAHRERSRKQHPMLGKEPHSCERRDGVKLRQSWMEAIQLYIYRVLGDWADGNL
jgi:hypothetical protein